MKIPSLSKVPDNKKFEFAARYYDPVKEDIDNRKSLIASELGMKNGTERFRMRAKLAFERSEKHETKPMVTQFLIAGALLALIYFIFV